MLLLDDVPGAAIPDKRLRVSYLHGWKTEGRNSGEAFALWECYDFTAPPQRTAKGGLGFPTPSCLVRTPVRFHPAHAERRRAGVSPDETVRCLSFRQPDRSGVAREPVRVGALGARRR